MRGRKAWFIMIKRRERRPPPQVNCLVAFFRRGTGSTCSPAGGWRPSAVWLAVRQVGRWLMRGRETRARPENESAAAFSCPNDICGGQRRGRRARVDRATSRYCLRARTRPSGSSRRGRVDAWLTRFTRRRRRKERIRRNYPELQNGGSGNFPEFRLLFPNVMKLEPNNSFQM